MWKFTAFCFFVTVSLSLSDVDVSTICKYVSIIDCNLFANHPVCGSNNITYDNHCLFSKAHCQDLDLHITFNGTCDSQNHGGEVTHGGSATYEFFCRNLVHTHCGTDMQLVCGSDDVTYDNFCYFEKARCLNRDLFIKEYSACI